MKNKILAYLKIVGKLVLIAAFIGLSSFAWHKQVNMPIKNLEITIDDSQNVSFVDENDITQTFTNKGIDIANEKYANINVNEYEKILDNDPSVLKSEVYKTIEGKIVIQIKQRTPIARIINMKNDQYYLDNEGKLMPLSNKYTSRILVVNGGLFESFGKYNAYNFSLTEKDDSVYKYFKLDEVYRIAKIIDEDEFLKAQIEQIYVDKDFVLIPKVGNHTIILGDGNNLSEKFFKLKVFYKTELIKHGIDKYKTINLKYKNQLVCTKAQV